MAETSEIFAKVIGNLKQVSRAISRPLKDSDKAICAAYLLKVSVWLTKIGAQMGRVIAQLNRLESERTILMSNVSTLTLKLAASQSQVTKLQSQLDAQAPNLMDSDDLTGLSASEAEAAQEQTSGSAPVLLPADPPVDSAKAV